MGLFDIVKRTAGRVGRNVMRDLGRQAAREIENRVSGGKGRSNSSRSNSTRTNSNRSTSDARASSANRNTAGLPGPNDRAIEYPVERLGLPDFDYKPNKDGAPDPGEVVWTWVPYEENDGRGKDRPVLVLADTDDHVVFAQMTSKDHDDDRERHASYGVYWMDIGTGNWDSKRRPSEVRLDRLLVTHMGQVRREGGQLDKAIYDDVVRALKELHK